MPPAQALVLLLRGVCACLRGPMFLSCQRVRALVLVLCLSARFLTLNRENCACIFVMCILVQTYVYINSGYTSLSARVQIYI